MARVCEAPHDTYIKCIPWNAWIGDGSDLLQFGGPRPNCVENMSQVSQVNYLREIVDCDVKSII